jgi:ABC-2 type transport system permease protein
MTIATCSITSTSTPSARRITMTRALKAEWTKLLTLPSNWRTAATTAVMAIGFGALAVFSQVSQWHSMSAQQRRAFDPTSVSLSGVIITTLILGTLAARTVTGEYTSGMIRSTFTAMPVRKAVLGAKAATVAAFVFPIALLCNVASFVIGQRILASKHLEVSITHPGVAMAIVLGTLGVSLMAVLGVALGGLIRHTAASAVALAVLIVGGLTIGQYLPAGVRQYLPATAMQASLTVHRSAGLLRPGTAIVVLAVYAVIALAAASMRAAHRDA